MAANDKTYLKELKEFKNTRLYFTVNRMIGMSYLEGYVVLQSIKRQLEELGYTGGCAVGGYFDAYNSNGCIIRLAADDELEQYLSLRLMILRFEVEYEKHSCKSQIKYDSCR